MVETAKQERGGSAAGSHGSGRRDVAWLKGRPIAHRGLHDAARGIPENSLAAAAAAVARGFAIEVDLHPAADSVPVVFHDDKLDRLTGEMGGLRERTSADLARLPLLGSRDTIPTLDRLLDLVGDRVGLVLELKGMEGADEGFAAAVQERVRRHPGPVAVMSFDAWLVADARAAGPDLAVGLTAEGDETTAERHRATCEAHDVDFVSYGLRHLPNAFVTGFRASGRPVISWTVRSPEAAALSARHADNITFEGFDPDRTG